MSERDSYGGLVFELSYGDTPPSMNSKESGFKSKHWGQGYRTKRRWQEIFETLLQSAGVPRGLSHVDVYGILTFTKPRGRDAENYIPVLSKAFGDALVRGLWIPNDQPEHYCFTGLRLAVGERVGTVLSLRCEE